MDGDQRETEQDPREADHNWPGKRELFTVECHELYINPDGRRVASVDTLSIVAVRLLVVNYTEGDYRRDDLS